MEAVFYKTEISEQKILAVFMELIRIDFKNFSNEPYAFALNVKRSFVIHQYLQTLQIFGNMETQEKQTLSLEAKDFVNNHQLFFKDNPAKEAAFYLGCATEILLNAQQNHLGNQPFSHKLNNLNIGYREMQKIHLALIEKLNQYESAKNLYGDYSLSIDLLFLFNNSYGIMNPNSDKLEISYAFSMGLVIQKEALKNRMIARKEAKNLTKQLNNIQN